MEKAFLNKHINIFLRELSESNLPLDLSLSRYFKAHKNLGSKDRKIIGDTIYGMVRWKSLLDALNPKDRLLCYQNIDWQKISQDISLPPFAKIGLNLFLYEKLFNAFGDQKTKELGRIFNTPAPMTIRANLLKTSREELLKTLQQKFECFPCTHSECGIQFKKREPLFTLPEFKQGLFEIQDEGSQLVAKQVEAKPKDLILDYCSGSGGKTLAFAHLMQHSGQIYLHDIRKTVLLEAKKRLKRAGIQNAQVLASDHAQLKKLKNKCDIVLIDVPCSGTGTLRRNPDQKWRIDASMLQKLLEEQRKIAKEAHFYLKPGGKLIYATCSILPEENESQVEFLLKELTLTLEKPPLSILPSENGMDGFFSAVFRKH